MEPHRIKHKKGAHFHETGSRDQCQCDIKCSSKALPGKAFCETHLEYCSRESPTTGAEPDVVPVKINEKQLIWMYQCVNCDMTWKQNSGAN
jgi:hypothetical protein